MLCYVTPKEHLGLPNKKDVKDGGACARPCVTGSVESARRGLGHCFFASSIFFCLQPAVVRSANGT